MDVDSLIATLVAERDTMRDTLTSCQNRCTELLEDNRRLRTLTDYLGAFKSKCAEYERSSVREHVAQFMRATDDSTSNPCGDCEYCGTEDEPEKHSGPHIPDDATLRLRLRLVAEEFFEMLEACGIRDVDAGAASCLFEISDTDLDVNLPALCDALADIDYVVEGFRLACGVDGWPIATEVHRSNMTKLPFTKDASGKVTKGPNFVAPDIEGELRKQGWGG